jgi:hypothetical protein
VNRDPTPANDDAFFDPPEPKTPPKKWGGKKLGFISLGLLILVILGNFARQPVANLIEYLMLPAETKETIRSGEIPGVQLVLPPEYPPGGF